ncbi:unnamed protein product [Pedinophyceae sp. YPF-701]|nr:unnamed protein product [Pedinophyceae sp. YPF-701]
MFGIAPARRPATSAHCEQPSARPRVAVCAGRDCLASKATSSEAPDRTVNGADASFKGRRAALGTLALAGAAAVLPSSVVVPAASASNVNDKDFLTTDSGLKILEVRKGKGDTPQKGDRVSVHWAGFTAGYQGKRIDNTSVRDEPFEWTIGDGTVIKAFEEAVQRMQAGGLVRIEVPGEKADLTYPVDKSQRFDGFNHYRYGPQPHDFDGQRALDFVYDNPTLQPFNRTLVFDISLLAVRKQR